MLKNLHRFNIQRRAFIYPLMMLVLMWIFYFVQTQGFFDHCEGAIMPLVADGLWGIIFSPLLHGGLEHILGNSVPMVILLFLLFQYYPKIAVKVFALGWFLSGLLVWLLPPINIFTGEYQYVCIIGASGLIYVLAFFIFFSGIFRKDKKLLTISLIVALYYGSLVWGVFPEELFSHLSEPSKISWQSHLAGAFIGIVLSLIYKKQGEEAKKKFIWEYPNYYSEKDDKLWQTYKEDHPTDFLDLPQKKEDDAWKYLEDLRKKH